MTDLTGKLIANTYKDLLTVNTSTTNTGLDNNLRKVQDGAGNSSSLKLSQTDAAFTGNVSVNGNLTVEGTFQPDTVNTNELQATRISATSITTNHLTAGTLIFQDVSVSSLRTGNLYAANISAGTVSATNINATNITVAGDSVATSSALASVEAIVSSNIVFVLNAQASVLTILAGLSATDVNLQNNINSVSTTVSAVNVQVGINATQINTLSTSITANASAIVVNSDAITSINSVLAGGAFASASTSATLETRIAGVSSTMATSINNSNTAITNLSATLESRIAGVSSTMAASIASTSAALESHINTVSATLSIANVSIAANSSQIAAVSVLTQTNKDAVTSINAILGDGSAYASAGTSATLETRIAAVSATMATSINNSNSAIAALSATMATSINNSNTNITTNTQAITSINGVLGDGSAYASAGTSATLQTKIAAVSSTLATSIGNSNTNIAAVSVLTKTNKDAITSINGVLGDGSAYASAGTSATLETRIAAVSATMATSINNSNTNIAAVSVLTKTNKDAITSINGVLGDGSAYASAGTSATLETRIAAVSSTMATSIGNSNSAITALSATMATSIANHLRLSGGTLTGALTLNADPTLNLQAATKQYVDNLTASGIHFHESVRVENPGALTVTYNNGTAGVGATLTNASTQAALVIDGITMVVDDRVLIYEQADATQNGVYVVTNVGSASTNWVLTRSSDTDTSGDADANSLDEGSYFFVEEGNTGAGESYICNTPGTITFGTTEITFVQFSSSISYTAGTGININASRVISTSGVATTGQLTTLSATMATSIDNSNTNIAAVSVLTKTNKDAITSINVVLGTGGAYASVGTSATLQTKINAVSATMATSINNSNTNITTNANAITSINGVLGTGAFASAGTSATLQTKIATLSATMATSIGNSNTNITTNANAITSINGVLGTGAFASAGTSATLQTKIATLSATMATSINNSNTNITTNAAAITSINGVLGTGAFASAGTSATLETRIAAVSATMATSIGNSNTAIATLSATLATSISNYLPLAGGTVTGDLVVNASIQSGPLTVTAGAFGYRGINILDDGGSTASSLTHVNGGFYLSGDQSLDNIKILSSKFSFQHPNSFSFNNEVSITGDLTVDTDTLYVDSTNNRVGVGLTDPTAALEVESTDALLARFSGGSTTAATKYIQVVNTSDDTLGLNLIHHSDDEASVLNEANAALKFGTNDTERMRIDSAGLVGINTTSPTAALDVVGSVISQVTINTQTGTTYTTVLTDQSKLVTLNNASAITLTIPANSSVAYPVGTKIDITQLGAGQVTVAGAGGVTVNATPTLKLRAQYSAATCIKIATDTWLLVGDLAES